jgi:cytochrome c556
MRIGNSLIAAVAVATGLVGAAQAQSVGPVTPTDIIAARQGGYDLMSALVGVMKTGVQSGADVKQYKDAADAIANWGKTIPLMFPAGTETGHETKALPAIWSDRAGFDKDAAALADAAQKLSQLAAADDKAGFAQQFQATGAACGACHRAYRQRS